MSVELIQRVDKASGRPFVPPASDYEIRSDEWVECEYHCYSSSADKVTCAFWEGEPGVVYLGSWPYDEICVLQKGRVALIDESGARREFSAGESFFIPRAFSGTWETIEPSAKVFFAIETGDQA